MSRWVALQCCSAAAGCNALLAAAAAAVTMNLQQNYNDMMRCAMQRLMLGRMQALFVSSIVYSKPCVLR